jgi:hypothetical protein
MPVEHLKSDLITEGYGDNGVDPAKARGRPLVSVGRATAAADGSSGSTYHLIDLPADCILMPRTRFKVDTWAYAQVVIGTLDDTDALLDVARSAATTQSPVADFDAGHGLPLWQRLGMSARPSDNKISLYAHAEAGGTQAGTMLFLFEYLTR